MYFWTMSPTGFSNSVSRVWCVHTDSYLNYPDVSSTHAVRPVLNLTADTQISDGDGTKENPFVVE